MLKHVISLVFLLSVFSPKTIYADNINMVLPQPKPEPPTNFIKNKNSILLPESKPNIIKSFSKKNIILPEIKPYKKKQISI